MTTRSWTLLLAFISRQKATGSCFGQILDVECKFVNHVSYIIFPDSFFLFDCKSPQPQPHFCNSIPIVWTKPRHSIAAEIGIPQSSSKAQSIRQIPLAPKQQTKLFASCPLHLSNVNLIGLRFRDISRSMMSTYHDKAHDPKAYLPLLLRHVWNNISSPTKKKRSKILNSTGCQTGENRATGHDLLVSKPVSLPVEACVEPNQKNEWHLMKSLRTWERERKNSFEQTTWTNKPTNQHTTTKTNNENHLHLGSRIQCYQWRSIGFCRFKDRCI